MFVKDSPELIIMVSEPDNWPQFKPQLKELRVLRVSFSNFILTYCPREMNKKTDLLANNIRLINVVFSTISTSVFYWFPNFVIF